MKLLPDDVHNRRLLEQVHPADWPAPEPAKRYNLVVVGGGTAGLVSAMISAGLGARVALVEQRLLGGDCLNFGCVPSKSLLVAAREIHARRGAATVSPESANDDFARVMQQMRGVRAHLAENDSAERFRAAGVDVFLGHGQFTGPASLTVNDRTLHFHRAVLATGSRAADPQVQGLGTGDYLTNETVFSLTTLPKHLAVLGGGPIGCELAQAFRRFGSAVTIIQHGDRLLNKEDAEASAMVQQRLASEGIAFFFNSNVESAARDGADWRLKLTHDGQPAEVRVDAVLAAAGRTPNVERLGLETAGVAHDKHGVQVDDYLRTTNKRIYAAGDICTRQQFTHAADAMARIVVRNALFAGRQRFSKLVIPRATYTAPEIAAVGLSEQEAADRGIRFDTYRVDFEKVDRAVIERATEGYAAVRTKRGSGKILGATIVGPHASELLAPITLALTTGKPLSALSETIFPYPTRGEVLKRLADQYTRTRLTPLAAKLLSGWLRLRK